MNLFHSAVMVIFCLLLQPSEASDAQRIAERYHAARTSRLPFPDILQSTATLTDEFLYDIQKKFVAMQLRNGATVGGYKGGFIPKSPIGGVLFNDGIISGNASIERRNFDTLLVEAEIAFRLCKTLGAPLADIDALKSAT